MDRLSEIYRHLDLGSSAMEPNETGSAFSFLSFFFLFLLFFSFVMLNGDPDSTP